MDFHRRKRVTEELSDDLTTLGNSEAKPLSGDLLAEEVRWQRSFQPLRGKPVRLEFTLHNASFFGFEFGL